MFYGIVCRQGLPWTLTDWLYGYLDQTNNKLILARHPYKTPFDSALLCGYSSVHVTMRLLVINGVSLYSTRPAVSVTLSNEHI